MRIEQQPQQQQARPGDVIGFGIAMAAAGVYFTLTGIGALPMPESGASAPMIVIALAGLAFLFAGGSLVIRGYAGARDHDGDLPAAAPGWAKISYRVLAIGIAGTLAIVGTWVALGSGPRHFNVSGLAPSGEALGRTVFGLGAVIVWIYVIAITVGTVRKIFDRSERRN